MKQMWLSLWSFELASLIFHLCDEEPELSSCGRSEVDQNVPFCPQSWSSGRRCPVLWKRSAISINFSLAEMILGDCLRFTKKEISDCRPDQSSAHRVVIAMRLAHSDMQPWSTLRADRLPGDTEDTYLMKDKGAFKERRCKRVCVPQSLVTWVRKAPSVLCLADSCMKQSKKQNGQSNLSCFSQLSCECLFME